MTSGDDQQRELCVCGWVLRDNNCHLTTSCCQQRLCVRCACGTAADGVCAACGNVCRSVRIVRDGEALFNSQQTRNGLKFGRVKGRREIVKTAALRRSLIEEHVRRHDAASTEEKERRVVMGIAYGERKYACSLNEGEQLSGTDEAVFLRFFQLMSTILVQGKRRPQPLDPTLIRGEYIAHCRANQSLLVRTVYAMLYASTREKDFAANMTENTMDVRMARACTISDIMLHTANPGSTYSWQRFIGVQLRGVAATPSVKKVLVRYGIMSENECATMRDLRSKLVPMDERARDGGVVVMTCQDNCHFVKVGIAKGEKRVHVFTNVLKMVIDEDFCEKTGILDACRERPRTAAGAAEAEGEDDIMVPQSDDDPANGDIDDLIGIISPRLQHAFECYIRAVRIGTGSIQVGGIDEFSDEANAEQIRIPKYYSSRVAKHAQIVAMKGRYEGINTEVQDADPSKIDDVRSLVEYSKKMGEDFVKHVQPHLQQVAQHLMEDGIHYHGDCGPIYLIHRHNMRGVVPRLGGFHTVGEMIHLWWRMFEYTHLRYFVSLGHRSSARAQEWFGTSADWRQFTDEAPQLLAALMTAVLHSAHRKLGREPTIQEVKEHVWKRIQQSRLAYVVWKSMVLLHAILVLAGCEKTGDHSVFRATSTFLHLSLVKPMGATHYDLAMQRESDMFDSMSRCQKIFWESTFVCASGNGRLSFVDRSAEDMNNDVRHGIALGRVYLRNHLRKAMVLTPLISLINEISARDVNGRKDSVRRIQTEVAIDPFYVACFKAATKMQIFDEDARVNPIHAAGITFTDGTTPKKELEGRRARGEMGTVAQQTDDAKHNVSATGELIRDLNGLKPFCRASELATGCAEPGTSKGALVLLQRQVGIANVVQLGSGSEGEEQSGRLNGLMQGDGSREEEEEDGDDDDGEENEVEEEDEADEVNEGVSFLLSNPSLPHSQTPYAALLAPSTEGEPEARDRRTTASFMVGVNAEQLLMSQ